MNIVEIKEEKGIAGTNQCLISLLRISEIQLLKAKFPTLV